MVLGCNKINVKRDALVIEPANMRFVVNPIRLTLSQQNEILFEIYLFYTIFQMLKINKLILIKYAINTNIKLNYKNYDTDK